MPTRLTPQALRDAGLSDDTEKEVDLDSCSMQVFIGEHPRNYTPELGVANIELRLEDINLNVSNLTKLIPFSHVKEASEAALLARNAEHAELANATVKVARTTQDNHAKAAKESDKPANMKNPVENIQMDPPKDKVALQAVKRAEILRWLSDNE